MSKNTPHAVEGEETQAPAHISDLSRTRFEIFRMENEERQLTFLIAAHRKEAERVLKKGKIGLAHLHNQQREKLQTEVKSLRAALSELKNQLEDMQDSGD